jgi:GNAT superfamily N-acetyltransferase
MADSEALALQHHAAADVAALRDELIAVHVDARSEIVDQPFYSAERYADRLVEHVTDPHFDLVTARLADQLVGYAYGGSLTPDTWWWTHLDPAPDQETATETGSRTFWLREILVRKAQQNHGYAHQIHDEILARRIEQRAALFVRVDNPARLMYRRWGWTVVGHLPPQGDSPSFEAMIRRLGPTN